MRSRFAVLLYVLSLVSVVVQFGYVFAGTDLLAHKGAAATVPLPLFIALMGVVQIILHAWRPGAAGWAEHTLRTAAACSRLLFCAQFLTGGLEFQRR